MMTQCHPINAELCAPTGKLNLDPELDLAHQTAEEGQITITITIKIMSKSPKPV